MSCSLRDIAIIAALTFSLPGFAATDSVTLRWYGHAFILLGSEQGVRVAMDPYGAIGYPMTEVEADVVTVSHEHGDHNGADRILGSPAILRGLSQDGRSWNPISFQKKDVSITAVPAYHDSVLGQRLGLNSIFIIEIGGLRLAHMSDVGNILSKTSAKNMGRIDVLFVPVGGNFSLDGRQAREIMSLLRPRITIPIHYKTPVTATWPIEDESNFLAGLKNVRRLETLTVSLTPETLPTQPEVWVMRYR